jgi:hypothetical protein
VDCWGLPAGVFVTIAALGTVWLLFISPAFVFNPLSKALGIEVPTTLLTVADEVIE